MSLEGRRKECQKFVQLKGVNGNFLIEVKGSEGKEEYNMLGELDNNNSIKQFMKNRIVVNVKDK